MKLKKFLIILFVSIVVFMMSMTTYAVTSKNKSNNIVDNKLKNAVSNESVSKNEVNNSTKNETTKNTKKNTTKKKNSKENMINEDLVNAKSDTDIEYKDIVINGNVFLASSNTIVLDNVRVDGDVVLAASKIEIINSEIKGSIYSLGKDSIIISSSELISLYCSSNNVEIGEDTEISRELRAIGSKITINGEIERDAYLFAKSVIFEDEAVVFGKTIIKSEESSISDDANIKDLDYEKIDGIERINYTYKNDSSNKVSYLAAKGIKVVIIVCIAIFILCCFPKFSKVNSSIRLRSLFKDFFIGLLAIICIFALVIFLFFIVYGIGYGLILLNLLIIFMILGKTLFIITFSTRLSCSSNNISKIKAIVTTLVVALFVSLFEAIELTGIVGAIIVSIVDFILSITGFGAIIRIMFSSNKIVKNVYQENIEIKDEEVVSAIEEKAEEKTSKEYNQVALQKEIKEEVKEEIEELKKEREEEKKLEKKDLNEKTEEQKDNIDSNEDEK